MPAMIRKNYSGNRTPPVEELVDTYVECNFSQPAAITDPDSGEKVGVPMFPESRSTPRTFVHCNLANCDMPNGSTVDSCNTAITTKEVQEENITVRGRQVRRITKRLDVAHARYVHTTAEDGTPVRTREELPLRP